MVCCKTSHLHIYSSMLFPYLAMIFPSKEPEISMSPRLTLATPRLQSLSLPTASAAFIIVSWRFPKPWGYPGSWMVINMEKPQSKMWMMTRGYPYGLGNQPIGIWNTLGLHLDWKFMGCFCWHVFDVLYPRFGKTCKKIGGSN